MGTDGGDRPDPAVVVGIARRRGAVVATAESLTAGALVARLVDVPGASAVVAGGAACYALAAKTRVLGVPAELLERTGAVTAEVAAAMAEGARDLYGCSHAVATTGVAGPGPDDRGVPAGTVHLAVAAEGRPTRTARVHLTGDRGAVRAGAVDAALDLLRSVLEEGTLPAGTQGG